MINSIEIKQSLYDQWKKSCTSQCSNGDDKLYKAYSVYRYQLKHVIKYIKRNFYGKQISKVSGDPKKTWQIINQIRWKCKKVIKPQFIINNEKVIQRRVIANEFNKYFVSLASKLNEEVSFRSNNYFNDFMPPTIMNSIFLPECTEEEILKIISELQNGKSSDELVNFLTR